MLTQLIRHIALSKIKSREYVVVSEFPTKESKSDNAMGLFEGEKVTVYTLLTAFIINSAPDAIMVLAERFAEELFNRSRTQ